MKNLADFLDQMGFIGHLDDKGALEFGDGTQRKFMQLLFKYYVGELDLNEFKKRVKFYWKEILLPSGEPARHWNHSKWPGQSGIMSRDNLWPYVCCLQAGGLKDEAWELFTNLLKRGFFLWNTKHIGGEKKKFPIPDWAGIGMIFTLIKAMTGTSPNNFNRGLNFTISLSAAAYFFFCVVSKITPDWTFYLFGLPFLLDDIFFSTQMLIRLIVGVFDRDNCGDDLNTLCRVVSGKVFGLGPFSWFLSFLYLRFMPKAEETKGEKYSDFGLLSRIQHYFAGPQNPPLDLLAKEVLFKLMRWIR